MAPKYELLEAFRRIFDGKKYLHRSSNQGDVVAAYLYEDLFTIGKPVHPEDQVPAEVLQALSSQQGPRKSLAEMLGPTPEQKAEKARKFEEFLASKKGSSCPSCGDDPDVDCICKAGG